MRLSCAVLSEQKLHLVVESVTVESGICGKNIDELRDIAKPIALANSFFVVFDDLFAQVLLFTD